MRKYMVFDAELFLKDSKRWQGEKADLLAEMDSMAELQRNGSESGGKGKTGDSTSAAVVERSRLKAQVDRLDMYQQALSLAWNCLSEPQRTVLTAFFYEEGSNMGQRALNCSEKLSVCLNEVYKIRREALAEISAIITSRYGL